MFPLMPRRSDCCGMWIPILGYDILMKFANTFMIPVFAIYEYITLGMAGYNTDAKPNQVSTAILPTHERLPRFP